MTEWDLTKYPLYRTTGYRLQFDARDDFRVVDFIQVPIYTVTPTGLNNSSTIKFERYQSMYRFSSQAITPPNAQASFEDMLAKTWLPLDGMVLLENVMYQYTINAVPYIQLTKRALVSSVLLDDRALYSASVYPLFGDESVMLASRRLGGPLWSDQTFRYLDELIPLQNPISEVLDQHAQNLITDVDDGDRDDDDNNGLAPIDFTYTSDFKTVNTWLSHTAYHRVKPQQKGLEHAKKNLHLRYKTREELTNEDKSIGVRSRVNDDDANDQIRLLESEVQHQKKAIKAFNSGPYRQNVYSKYLTDVQDLPSSLYKDRGFNHQKAYRDDPIYNHEVKDVNGDRYPSVNRKNHSGLRLSAPLEVAAFNEQARLKELVDQRYRHFHYDYHNNPNNRRRRRPPREIPYSFITVTNRPIRSIDLQTKVLPDPNNTFQLTPSYPVKPVEDFYLARYG